jgi:hypothetical protein
LASIPDSLNSLISRCDKVILEASIIHDYLYSYPNDKHHANWTRKQADMVLKEAMTDLGASWFIRNAVYQAVRMFGGEHWVD